MLRWTGALVAAVMTVAACSASARPEPNAFLNKRVASHAQLCQQVRNDKIVMDRYMRHFGMTRGEVLAMVKGLHKSQLREAGVYQVYNVPDSGEVRTRAFMLKKGTPVWADKAGTPVLKWSCGNPMKAGSDVQANQLLPLAMDPTATVELRALDLPLQTDLVAMIAAEPSEPPLPESSGGEIVADEPGETPTEGPTTVGSSGAMLVAPLGLLSSGSLLMVRLTERDGPPPRPVPEPATLVATGFGVALLAARKWSTRR